MSELFLVCSTELLKRLECTILQLNTDFWKGFILFWIHNANCDNCNNKHTDTIIKLLFGGKVIRNST